MSNLKTAGLAGLSYGLLLFVFCRGLSFSDRPWARDAVGAAVAAVVFTIIWYLLIRHELLSPFKFHVFKSWKEASVNVLIGVLMVESLFIAQALIIWHKPDFGLMISAGIGIAIAMLISIAASRGKESGQSNP